MACQGGRDTGQNGGNKGGSQASVDGIRDEVSMERDEREEVRGRYWGQRYTCTCMGKEARLRA